MTFPGLDSSGPDADQFRREIQLACFRLAGEMYAVDIMRIKEIIRPQRLTIIPKAPAFIDGMINLRGMVIPIIDLRKRFGLSPIVSDRKTRIIICATSAKFVGLLVDEVVEVRRYLRHEVKPSPPFIQGKDAGLFLAVCQREPDLVMLIDLERMFTFDEMDDLNRIAGAEDPDPESL